MLSNEQALGYQKARALLAGGPFDVYNVSLERKQLLAETFALLFPDEDKLCITCPGKMIQAFREVRADFQLADAKQLLEAVTPAQLDQSNPTPPATKNPMKNASVFKFRDPKTTYREHGSPTTYTAANLTDAVARRMIAADPNAAELFEEFDPAELKGETATTETTGKVAEDDETIEELEARIAAKRAAQQSEQKPLSLEEKIAAARKELGGKKRDELDSLFSALMPDAGDPKQFDNKGELVDALVAYQFRDGADSTPTV